TVARHPPARGIAVAEDATQTFDRIKEPGLAAHGEIETTIAVRDDVEPRALLFADDAGDCVKVLFAKQGIAERGLEGSPGEAAVKPKRSRVGTGDGGGQNDIARDREHDGLRGCE